MAISIRAVGSWAAATATTQTVTLPTHAAGDMLLVRVVAKGPTTLANNVVICNTSGWTAVGAMVFGGTTASGNGSGSVWARAFYKIASSAAETNPVLTFQNPSGTNVAMLPSAAVALSFQKGSTETWVTPVGAGGAIAAATSFSCTTGAIHAQIGDMFDAFVGTNDNTTLTVPALGHQVATTGVDTEAPAAALSSATSNDIAADGCYALVTSGTGSGGVVITGTNSVADEGVGYATRLRVDPINTTVAYRFRNDDGSESTATWIAAQSTDISHPVDTNLRLRFETQNTNGVPSSMGATLQYNRNGAGWNNVTSSSTYVRTSDSPNVTDATTTTNQLTAGTGTFGSGYFDDVQGSVASHSMSPDQHAEEEFCFILRSADGVAANDTIQLRNSLYPDMTATVTVTASGFSLSGGAAFGWTPAATLSENFIVSSSAPAFGWAPGGELSWPLPITIDSGGGAFGWAAGGTLAETFITSGGATFGWSPGGTLAETFATSGGAAFGWAPAGTLSETFATSGGATFGWSPAGTASEEFIASSGPAFGWAPGGTLDHLSNNVDISGGPVFGWAPAGTASEDFLVSGGAAFGWAPNATVDNANTAVDLSGGPVFGWTPGATLSEDFLATSAAAFGWGPSATLSENFIATGGPTFGWKPGGTLAETFTASGGPVFGWSPAATVAETFITNGGAAFGWAPGGTLDATANAFDLSGGAAFGWMSSGYIEIPVAPQDDGGAGPRRGRKTPFDDWSITMDDESILELYLLGKTR